MKKYIREIWYEILNGDITHTYYYSVGEEDTLYNRKCLKIYPSNDPHLKNDKPENINIKGDFCLIFSNGDSEVISNVRRVIITNN